MFEYHTAVSIARRRHIDRAAIINVGNRGTMERNGQRNELLHIGPPRRSLAIINLGNCGTMERNARNGLKRTLCVEV